VDGLYGEGALLRKNSRAAAGHNQAGSWRNISATHRAATARAFNDARRRPVAQPMHRILVWCRVIFGGRIFVLPAAGYLPVLAGVGRLARLPGCDGPHRCDWRYGMEGTAHFCQGRRIRFFTLDGFFALVGETGR